MPREEPSATGEYYEPATLTAVGQTIGGLLQPCRLAEVGLTRWPHPDRRLVDPLGILNENAGR